jgi:GntR family L-lactate dehydrogenase operon transcriptional regulator
MSEHNVKDIVESSVFRGQREELEYLALRFLSNTSDPVGSWVLNDYLEQNDIKSSLATVGRLLKTLDDKQYTTLRSRQGRVITQQGREYLEKKEAEMHMSKLQSQLIDSVRVNSVKELVNLFAARILIETQVVKMVTTVGSNSQFERLMELVEDAQNNIDNLKRVTHLNGEFHKEIFRITDNRFLISIENILMAEQWNLEISNEGVRSGYEQEINVHSHREIVEAMIARDEDLTTRLMQQHLEKLRDDALGSIRLGTL